MSRQKASVAIVGAGPAGLAMAAALKNLHIPFTVYEKHSDSGGIWDMENEGTPMYEAAHFISSKTLSGFQGFPMPEDYPDYPSRAQILQYIRAYTDHCGLRPYIRFGQKIIHANWEAGNWTIQNEADEVFQHTDLICANGPLWQPNSPHYTGLEQIPHRHSNTFKKSTEFLGKRILVVGGGNSGVDIACEAATYADKAYISLRRGYYFIPKHVFGMPSDVFGHAGPKLPTRLNQWVLSRLLKLVFGDQTKFGLPKPDHKILESHPVLNSQIFHHTTHGNLMIKPDIDRIENGMVFFKDHSTIEVDEIILATGFDYAIPYAAPYFDWKDQRPVLFMNLFNPRQDHLFALGFMETNSAAYELFGEMAALIARYIKARVDQPELAQKFRKIVETEQPDLSGGLHLVHSARHTGYVDSDAYRAYLKKLNKKMGWTN